MPLYDMTCENCGHREEHNRLITDGPPTKCPACKSKRYQMVWHPFLVNAHYSPMHPRHMRGKRPRR
jgi:putative FmdB family regulatory protein